MILLLYEWRDIMAVKLRLMRMGAKKKPFYRIVAADSRTKRDGKYIELVGTYNPVAQPAEINVNEEVALKWLSQGAIPTDTVKSIFRKVGVNEKFHISKSQRKEVK
jgi:small subunit ribosomal protein S16